MRFQSKERARQMRRQGPERKQFLKQFEYCWVCGSNWEMTVHEILRGGSRGVALDHRLTWFAACAECNCGVLNDAIQWPIQRQLAVKFLMDELFFDLPMFCQLKREAVTAYTMEDIKPYIEAERIRLL